MSIEKRKLKGNYAYFSQKLNMPYNYPQNQPQQPQNTPSDVEFSPNSSETWQDAQNAWRAGKTNINLDEYLATSLTPEVWLQQNPGKTIRDYRNLQMSARSRKQQRSERPDSSWLQRMLPPGLQFLG